GSNLGENTGSVLSDIQQYQALAKALELSPPNMINQFTVALEHLIEEDATAGRPLIAAFVISKARGGLPALGFFECAKRVGMFHGDPLGPKSSTFLRSSSMKLPIFGARLRCSDRPLADLHARRSG
ncbi:hypothetical protein, partial [Sulfitobacter sp.]|uniref:hypothetical protein n=1 Tax=Sulfitobacter sp. TaxID=1903071 RepID=UPI0030015C12